VSVVSYPQILRRRQKFKAARGAAIWQHRMHQTIRVTLAMEAGIADHVWSIEESSLCLPSRRAWAEAPTPYARGSSRASKQTGKPHEAKQDHHDERNSRHDRIPRLVFGPHLQKNAILPALRPVRIFLVIPKHLGLSSLGHRQGLVYNRPIQKLR
jgi:hypothetical protein